MKLALQVLSGVVDSMKCEDCPYDCKACQNTFDTCMLNFAFHEVKQYYEEHEKGGQKNANGKNNEIKSNGND